MKLLEISKEIYCGKIGYEFMHMADPDEKHGLERELKGKKKELNLLKMEKKQF